ncbi:MAG: DNA translocase FtsK [Bacteroidetes bacterium]|nr:DNA translocase FtsK [Bacteroidota bacterium]MBS1741142.1 DNA translocase FtsK [Bacteroidota bacterium]
MSSKKKNTPTTNQSVPLTPTVNPIKRQFRLGFGIFFFLLGIYICFAIGSYIFTWQIDQDKVMARSITDVLRHSVQVENKAGLLGAYIAHNLVFRGAGIFSILGAIWILAWGINLTLGKRVLPLMRFLRWFSFILLIGAPFLSYFFPTDGFPYGGAWGNEAIDYLKSLVGSFGTALILIGLLCFFIFVIFALDITPLFKKTKKTTTNLPDSPPQDISTEETPTSQPDDSLPLQKTIAEKFEQAEKSSISISINDSALDKVQPVFEEFEKKIIADETDPIDTLSPHQSHSTPTLTFTNTHPKVAPKDDLGDLSFEVIRQQDEPIAPINGRVSVEGDDPYDPSLELSSYKFPILDLLEDRNSNVSLNIDELEKNKKQIETTLKSFGIDIQKIHATVGPTVTLYEIVPAEGVRISKIRNLEDDIALNLAALGIRIIAPIPGKGTIGIEVPNANKEIVSMRALLSSEKFVSTKMSLPIALGKKIDNENYIVDLATMPHLLMAGATGQGKSVGINAILVSLLYKKHPSQLKFVLVDPKKVELSIYRQIEKHFLAKLPNEEEAIITDTKKVIHTLNALCIEMDNRYELLKDAKTRNIKEYNEKFIGRKLNPQNGHQFLPFIVLVVDEFADLIMTAGKEVEMPIARLAQLARAVGIHLIVATQRPSVNVITGTIKANFPARIAFKVSAKVDSRTILDTGGAEQLVGRGDMLVSHGSDLLRLQCAFVDTPEVEKIVEYIGSQRGYPTAFELPEYEGDEEGEKKSVDLSSRDKLFEECAKVVVQTQSGSTSMLQRRFNLGYNRAGRIMDQLEAAGIVGPSAGSKPRDVLFHTEAELIEFLSSL